MFKRTFTPFIVINWGLVAVLGTLLGKAHVPLVVAIPLIMTWAVVAALVDAYGQERCK